MMTWILIAISTGGSYNSGTTTGIEFANRQSCIYARNEIKQHAPYGSVHTLCVPKDVVHETK